MNAALKLPPALLARVACLLFALLACCLAAAPSALAGDGEPAACLPLSIRPQDQIWLVSTRELDCVDCRLTEAPRPAVWQFDHARNGWQVSAVSKFLATDDPRVPTNVFIHGNWIGFEESVEKGFTYYLHQAAVAPSKQPLRLVIWSWPSTRGRRPLRDLRAKYARTESEAEYMAWFLARISPKIKVSLVGYSFGAAVATGALHRLALHGGALEGQPTVRVEREPNRAVLFAAAEGDYSLADGGAHELALSRLDALLNLTNSCDPALKWFRLVDTCERSSALGYRGAAGLTTWQAAKVRELDCAPIVGKQHYWRPYVTTPSLIAEMRPYIWFEDAFAPLEKGALPVPESTLSISSR